MDKETCHNLLMKIFDPTRPDPTTRTGGGNGNRSVPRERQTCGHTSKPMDQVTCLQALSVYRSQLRHPSLILVVPPIEKKSWWLRETSDEFDCRHSMYIWKEFVSRVHGSRNKKVPSIF